MTVRWAEAKWHLDPQIGRDLHGLHYLGYIYMAALPLHVSLPDMRPTHPSNVRRASDYSQGEELEILQGESPNPAAPPRPGFRRQTSSQGSAGRLRDKDAINLRDGQGAKAGANVVSRPTLNRSSSADQDDHRLISLRTTTAAPELSTKEIVGMPSSNVPNSRASTAAVRRPTVPGSHEMPAGPPSGPSAQHRHRRTVSMQSGVLHQPQFQHQPQQPPLFSQPPPNGHVPPLSRPSVLIPGSGANRYAGRTSLDSISAPGLPAVRPPGATFGRAPDPFVPDARSSGSSRPGPSRPLPQQSFTGRPPQPSYYGRPPQQPQYAGPGVPLPSPMNGSFNPPHGQPGHFEKGCEQCRHLIERVYAESRQSAEADGRRRTELEAQEAERIQRMAQQSREEEEMQRAMQESLALSEEQKVKERERDQHEQLEERVLEESRRSAQQQEEALRRIAQVQTEAALQRSRAQAEADERRRREEEERERAIEARVLEESRKEQEREWRRREEEETLFLQAIQAENGGAAGLWQQMQNDAAFAPAFEAQRRHSLRAPRRRPQARGSSPLPPLPPRLELEPRGEFHANPGADPVFPASPGPGEEEEEELADPFSDAAEVPPLYEEAIQAPVPATAGPTLEYFPRADVERPPLVQSSSEPGPVTAVAHQLLPPPNAVAIAASPEPAVVTASSSAASSPLHSPHALSSSPIPVRHSSSGMRSRPLPRVPGLQGLLQPLVPPQDAAPHRPVEIEDFDSIIATTRSSRSNSSLSLNDHTASPSHAHESIQNELSSAQADAARRPSASPSTRSFTGSLLSVETGSSVSHDYRAQSLAHSSNRIPQSLSQSAMPSAQSSHASLAAASSSDVSLPLASTSGTASSSRVPRFEQKTPQGVDWGYAAAPFEENLYASPTGSSIMEGKDHFPTIVTLHAHADKGKSLATRSQYFVIRAQTWKALLRALAWFGNTRIEAGPEEVANAAPDATGRNGQEVGQCRLMIDVEFVTPQRWDVQLEGIEPRAREAGPSLHAKPARVAVCLSLVQTRSAAISSVLIVNNRELDTRCLQRGSSRKALILPSKPPTLPISVVDLAQHMHASHAFSAACPSTSSSMMNASPRDLHNAVEKHDHKYFAKRRKEGAARLGAPEETLADDPTGIHHAATGEYVQPNALGRMKGKVMKKLAKKRDDQALNEDLSTWITPLGE